MFWKVTFMSIPHRPSGRRALVLLSGMNLTLVCLWKIIRGEAKFEQDNEGGYHEY